MSDNGFKALDAHVWELMRFSFVAEEAFLADKVAAAGIAHLTPQEIKDNGYFWGIRENARSCKDWTLERDFEKCECLHLCDY